MLLGLLEETLGAQEPERAVVDSGRDSLDPHLRRAKPWEEVEGTLLEPSGYQGEGGGGEKEAGREHSLQFRYAESGDRLEGEEEREVVYSMQLIHDC